MKTASIIKLMEVCLEEEAPLPFDLYCEAHCGKGWIVKDMRVYYGKGNGSGLHPDDRDALLNTLYDEGVEAAVKLLESYKVKETD